MLTILIALFGVSGVAGLTWWLVKYAESKKAENAEKVVSNANKEAYESAKKIAEIQSGADIIDVNELADRLQGKHRN